LGEFPIATNDFTLILLKILLPVVLTLTHRAKSLTVEHIYARFTAAMHSNGRGSGGDELLAGRYPQNWRLNLSNLSNLSIIENVDKFIFLLINHQSEISKTSPGPGERNHAHHPLAFW